MGVLLSGGVASHRNLPCIVSRRPALGGSDWLRPAACGCGRPHPRWSPPGALEPAQALGAIPSELRPACSICVVPAEKNPTIVAGYPAKLRLGPRETLPDIHSTSFLRSAWLPLPEGAVCAVVREEKTFPLWLVRFCRQSPQFPNAVQELPASS